MAPRDPSMNDLIDIQHACTQPIPVSDDALIQWAQSVLVPLHATAELTLRLVDKHEITDLNRVYRKQDKATNVLAFPSALPPEIQVEHPFLGDVIICPAVLEEESVAQHVPLIAHWAHIVIHGVLHLLGHDHLEEHDTALMQALEIKALAQLGFDNPYATEDHPIE